MRGRHDQQACWHIAPVFAESRRSGQFIAKKGFAAAGLFCYGDETVRLRTRATLRVSEAADLLGITPFKLRGLVRDGLIPHGYLPGLNEELRFDPAVIESFRKTITGLN